MKSNSLNLQELEKKFYAELTKKMGIKDLKTYIGDSVTRYPLFISYPSARKTIELLQKILTSNEERIYVLGDRDVDGVSAVTIFRLCVNFLQDNELIPSELEVIYGFPEGYGLSLEHAKTLVDYSTVITVDCGIKDVEAIDFLQKQGIKCIVLDHHLPDLEKLPPTPYIINPHLDNMKPYEVVSGATVVFFTMLSILETMQFNSSYLFIEENDVYELYNPYTLEKRFSSVDITEVFDFLHKNLVRDVYVIQEDLLAYSESFQLIPKDGFIYQRHYDKHLSQREIARRIIRYMNFFQNIFYKELITTMFFYAALSNLADIMPQVGVNRAIFRNWYENRNNTMAFCKKLLERFDIYFNSPSLSSDLVFSLIPALNTLCREENPIKIVLLFTNELSEEEGLEYINYILHKNTERKQYVQAVSRDAEQYRHPLEACNVYIFEDLKAGYTGLLANVLLNKDKKACCVITESDDLLVGSFRTTWDVSLLEVLPAHLFESFGGHKNAAGFSLKKEKLQELLDFLKKLPAFPQPEKVEFDVSPYIPLFSYRFFEEMFWLLNPLGNGNELPIFALNNAICINTSLFGKDNNHSKVILQYNKQILFEAIKFFESFNLQTQSAYSIRFSPSVNRKTLRWQAILYHIEPVAFSPQP